MSAAPSKISCAAVSRSVALLFTPRLPSAQEVIAHFPSSVDEVRAFDLRSRRELDELVLSSRATAKGLPDMQALEHVEALQRHEVDEILRGDAAHARRAATVTPDPH